MVDAGCGLNGVGGSGGTSSTLSAHQTQSLFVPGVLTLYNGHDVRGNMVDAGGARFYEYSVLNQATSIWRDNASNPTIRSRFAYGSDGQRGRRQTALEAHHARHPERYVNGPPKAARPPDIVCINPIDGAPETAQALLARPGAIKHQLPAVENGLPEVVT